MDETIKQTTDENLTLLLLYKDNLSASGEAGLPLVTESETIKLHEDIITNPELPIQDIQPAIPGLLDNGFATGVSKLAPSTVGIVPDNCFVWGWWRKPWETHYTLLQTLLKRCKSGDKPEVLLYNQYLRRIYKACLHDVYFVPGANTVEIPRSWASKCPTYYSSKQHLCGAFFVLELLKGSEKEGSNYLDSTSVLQKYYIDTQSFDFEELEELARISPPDGIAKVCRSMIDKKPASHLLKGSEHTMFALRMFQQTHITRGLLNRTETNDKEIATAFANMDWTEVMNLLRDFTLDEWKKLSNAFQTFEAISTVAGRSETNLSKFDLLLIAWMVSTHLLQDLFTKEGSEQAERQSCKLVNTLAKWVTEKDVIEQRRLASEVFVQVWDAIRKRYGLVDFSQYFKRLPEFEEVAYSTKYGIKEKFYRDHLNHNIRAALASGFFADKLFSNEDSRYSNILVAFLAGLFHDIALPISSYESTVQTLQDALSDLGIITSTSMMGLPIDRTKLKECLSVVALYSSLPKLEELRNRDDLHPWSNRDVMLDLSNPQILFEEMLCSLSDEHALLSATVVFLASAVEKAKGGQLGVGIRQIAMDGFGNNSTTEGFEFINLIQSIALHDRKAASEYSGAREEQPGVPTGLVWDDFPIPLIVSIADDLQEWGRPIGKFDQPIVMDSRIELSRESVKVENELRIDSSALGNVPYSFLEHIFAKMRNLSRIRRYDGKGGEISVDITMIIKGGELQMTHIGVGDSSLELHKKEKKIVWPEKPDLPGTLRPGPNGDLYSLERPLNILSTDSVRSDFLILRGEPNLRDQLKEQIGQGAGISSVSTDGSQVKIVLKNVQVDIKLDTYLFAYLDESETVPNEKIRFDNEVGIIQGQLMSVNQLSDTTTIFVKQNLNKNIHLYPHPHFLDLDWRFSWETSQAVMKFLSLHRLNGRICYLGCPTLALYHELQSSELGIDWCLIDKGHYTISEWVKKGLLDENKYVQHDLRKQLPKHLLKSFDAVIMDPPWYKEDYAIFWKRGLELVNVDGIIGVSEYPGYDQDKLETFSRTRRTMMQTSGRNGFFASIQISYSAPPFESYWEEDIKFTHSASHTYRPTYMDFYRIEVPSTRLAKSESIHTTGLTEIIDLHSGHYIRCKIFDWNLLSNKGVIMKTRETLERYLKDRKSIIAWSTNNTLVEIASKGNGEKITNQEELKDAVIAWEKRNARDYH